MPDLSGASFTAPASKHSFRALLFDMDGTIIDSTPAIEKYWAGIGAEIGADPAVILKTSHGRRTMDTLAILAPEKANWEYILEREGRVPLEHGQDAIEIPGARGLLAELTSASVPWAIVTSGTQPLVQGWLKVMGLAQPAQLVTAESVKIGKPDPSCYLLGAERLGVMRSGGTAGDGQGGHGSGQERSEVLVLEDAPSGIRAGKAAGFKVVAVATSHELEELVGAGADWVVRDLRSVALTGVREGRAEVEIRDALVR